MYNIPFRFALMKIPDFSPFQKLNDSISNYKAPHVNFIMKGCIFIYFVFRYRSISEMYATRKCIELSDNVRRQFRIHDSYTRLLLLFPVWTPI